jgi:ABC-type multidrug transport system ATPase subunit/ABC-type multidrug transport system permease subunit
MGFLCKPRQTTADFLTAITDPTGRRVKEDCVHSSPRSPDDFVRLWKESKYYAQLQQEMELYRSNYCAVDAELEKLKQLQSNQKATRQRAASPYTASIAQQFFGTIKRSYQRVIGDKVYLVAMAFSAIFMSLINGSVFVNTPSNTSGFFSKGGVIFFSVLFNALQTMSEVATQYAQRPIVQKHKGFAFYHPFVDSLSSLTADWPIKFINILVFDLVLYFIVGLKKDAGPFFIFVLVTYLTALVMSAMFRTIAAATKQSEIASGISGILVLILSIYTGYVIPVPSMHPWFAWLRYINPVAYGFEALMVNEFHEQSGLCSTLVPSGPGFENVNSNNQVCAVTGSKPGLLYVSGDDYLLASFGYEYSHLWRNIGILISFGIFFVITCAIATEFNPPPPPKGEFLVFRKGREPNHVKEALASGKVVSDTEHGGDGEVLTGIQTRLSEFRGLVKSKDVFTWEHINYDIVLPDGTLRRLLDDVTGYVKPGTLTALMGESGAGKTTLLNVLARRVGTGVVTGDASVNGLVCPSSFQRRTGYVQQQDIHTAESTVREALRFSALLRQTSDVSIEEKYQYVERVIEMLEMEDYAEAIIGTPGNGLNVEQRKRTTIGIELVAKPALLLFLDEPTSGLDSQSAWSIVRVLRKLANSGQAILCTIHQPSSVLFEQFDRLLLLKKGGRTVYFGKIGQNSQDIIQYFESNGAIKCQLEDNPAEYILQVIGAGATAKADRDWADEWGRTIYGRQTIEETRTLKAEYKELAGVHLDHEDGEERAFAASWLTQFRAVQLRVLQIYWRNPSYINSKVLLNIVAGLFLGFTFYQEKTSVQGMQNKVNLRLTSTNHIVHTAANFINRSSSPSSWPVSSPCPS